MIEFLFGLRILDFIFGNDDVRLFIQFLDTLVKVESSGVLNYF